jgi:hypothetical protein
MKPLLAVPVNSLCNNFSTDIYRAGRLRTSMYEALLMTEEKEEEP